MNEPKEATKEDEETKRTNRKGEREKANRHLKMCFSVTLYTTHAVDF